MRRILEGVCAVVVVLIAARSAAAADGRAALTHGAHADARAPVASVACLGGVLNDGPSGSYLTVANYPAFSTLGAGLWRSFICGDGVPSFLPSSERERFASRRHR